MRIPALYIIGSGNLAWQLSKGLQQAGLNPTGIIARNKREGKKLAHARNCLFLDASRGITAKDAVFFCCVSDDAIDATMDAISLSGARLIHCSGMHPLRAKAKLHKEQRAGVFYPVQSFNKKLEVDWKKIPVCIESHDRNTEKLLISIAQQFAGPVYKMNSATRAYVHLAAVFANNFGNAQFAIAHQVLQLKKVSFNILKPLIAQTSEKVQMSLPESVQTGPAIRNDSKTIAAHKKLLKEKPELSKIYTDLTQFIQLHLKKD